MRRVRPALLLAAVVVASTASPAAAYKRPGKTERISVSTSGAQVTGHNIDAAISPDGRFVVFASSASTLVPGDTNGAFDVFVRDLGAHVTERVSVASDGKEANGPSASGFSYYRAKITPGGRFVVFASDASNLVPGDTNDQTDVFVHDRLTRKTELVSAPAGGGVGDRSSVYPAISTDGRYVAFVSWATNMVPGDTNEAGDVFVRDRLAQRTERVSLATSGAEANGLSLPAFISGDGRFVAFGSSASNLVPNDNNATSDVFVRDRATGTTERVSVSVLGGNANGVSNAGGISDDGRFVVFSSAGTNLVPDDTNGLRDIFVYDRQTKVTERVSGSSTGAQPQLLDASEPSISPDGRYVGYETQASNIVAADSNDRLDVFLHDRHTRSVERVSVSSSNAQGNGHSLGLSIASGARFVAYSSTATNLIPGDTNGHRDVFVRDRGTAAGPNSMTATTFASWTGPMAEISGAATFSPGTLLSADDPATDGGAQAVESGAEIVSAAWIHRWEEEDHLVRIGFAGMPGNALGCDGEIVCPRGAGPRPGIFYGLEFMLDGVRHEIRGMRVSATAVPPSTPYIALYRCVGGCVEVARLAGSIGATGSELLASIPESLLGASGELTEVRGFSGIGEAAAGMTRQLDEVHLGGSSFAPPTVMLGTSAPGAGEHQVQFTVSATLEAGTYRGNIALPPGQNRVWARGCAAGACSSVSTLVEVR